MNADFWNMVRREIANYIRGEIADPRIGTVIAVDTGAITGLFAARVQLLPEGTETGWLPIQMPWVGNGWGAVMVPAIGAQVHVSFIEHNRSVGTITGLHFDTRNPPPQGAQAGECWLVHQSGAAIKMLASGDLDVIGAGGASSVTLAANGDIIVQAKAGQKVQLGSDTEADLGNLTQALQTFVLSTCASAINGHKHRIIGVQGGGGTFETTAPESTLIQNSDITTVAKGN